MPAPVPSVASFLIDYPDFNGASATLIERKLIEAAKRTNPDVYEDNEIMNYAVMLRAAVLLLTSPYGQKLRSSNPDQAFAWEFSLRQVQRASTMGLRVF